MVDDEWLDFDIGNRITGESRGDTLCSSSSSKTETQFDSDKQTIDKVYTENNTYTNIIVNI